MNKTQHVEKKDNIKVIVTPLRKVPHVLGAIGNLKLLATTNPCLKNFNPNFQTHLKIGISSIKLGALLEQNHGTLTYPKWYPTGYASRSLPDYEKYYAQIEKETLSIVFGVERFHEYLYGLKFTVINDPQPLKPIFSKCASHSEILSTFTKV